VLLLVAALGLVVLPVLHAARHRMDHVHGPLVQLASRATPQASALHQHGNGQLHVDLDGLFIPAAPVPDHDAPAGQDSERDHAGSSLLHGAAGVLLDAVTTVLPPQVCAVGVMAGVAAQERPLHAFFLVVRSAQGPPASVPV